MAVTRMGPCPTSIKSSPWVTEPVNRPCTESYLNICALVCTGPRSLIAMTCRSVRPDSTIARSTLRPMRPNPLIATFNVISVSHLLLIALTSQVARKVNRRVYRQKAIVSIRSRNARASYKIAPPCVKNQSAAMAAIAASATCSARRGVMVTPKNYWSCPIFAAKSAMRTEKPHSLSYHDNTRTVVLPTTLV